MSVEMDQLLCLPLPLTPAKGFSWIQTRLWRRWRLSSSFPWSAGCGQLRNIGRGEDGSQFVLGGATSLCSVFGVNAQFPELLVEVLHKGSHAGTDGPK